MKNSHCATGIRKLEAENCWYCEVVKSLSLSLLKVYWESVKLLLLGCWVIGEEALFSETPNRMTWLPYGHCSAEYTAGGPEPHQSCHSNGLLCLL